MYSRPRLALKFLEYYIHASNGKGHGMHSPFVFNLITRVMNDPAGYPAYATVENLRRRLRHDQSLLDVEDLGAGSVTGHSTKRTVASIARHAAKPRKWGQLLYRMVRHYRPAHMLELGTSLGISSSYLALGNPDARLITLEGAKAVAAMAKRNFQSLQLDNISIIEGNFDVTLPKALMELPSPDFCFIDGNHRQEPTERYFNQILPSLNNDSILIFDDIHWSPGMEAAWQTICQHEQVRCTIDLFFIGIVLFRKEFREKQHFSIRF